MKALRLVLLLTMLTVYATQPTKAQSYTNACYVASTGRIWEATGGCGYYIMVCNGSDYEYATITGGSGAACTPCSGTGSGVRVNINVIPCPIDDYVWVLMTGISAVFYLKRKKIFTS